MEKRNKLILIISAVVCGVLIISISLTFLLVKPRTTCCSSLIYTSYSHPNNSTNHFSVNVINCGAIEVTIANMTSFWFTNASNVYYPLTAYNNFTEISFPFIIESEIEVNITLELNWHFTVGSQYIFTLEYDYGKSFDITFFANESS